MASLQDRPRGCSLFRITSLQSSCVCTGFPLRQKNGFRMLELEYKPLMSQITSINASSPVNLLCIWEQFNMAAIFLWRNGQNMDILQWGKSGYSIGSGAPSIPMRAAHLQGTKLPRSWVNRAGLLSYLKLNWPNRLSNMMFFLEIWPDVPP